MPSPVLLIQGTPFKLTMNFRGREVTHADLGENILRRIAEELQEVGVVEMAPRLEGRNMIMLMTPLSGAARRKAKEAQETASSE